MALHEELEPALAALHVVQEVALALALGAAWGGIAQADLVDALDLLRVERQRDSSIQEGERQRDSTQKGERQRDSTQEGVAARQHSGR